MNARSKFKLSFVAAVCMGVAAVPVYAGQIVGVQQALPSPVLDGDDDWKNGFGGWNLDNVNVKIVNVDTGEVVEGKTFDKLTGSYTEMMLGDTFVSEVTDGAGNIMSNLHGKDWPVGEPSGVKAITNPNIDATLSHDKPASCLLSTSFYQFKDDPDYAGLTPEDGFLGSDNPNPTLCDSPFQTHKRFKVDALPAVVDGVGTEAIDLVFNVEAEEGTRRYMVLQKLNNYTDKRLGSFKIELGFGVGENFQNVGQTTANDAGENLTLSIGIGENTKTDPVSDIWEAEDLAVFSAGLFGTADEKHPEDGFFDTRRAGFFVELSADSSTIASTAAFPSNYTTILGDWLPSIWEPTGIFYDFDSDPLTDATLVAVWGDNPNTPDVVDYQWLLGNADGFIPVPADQLQIWIADPLYAVGTIEDVLNLGLTYIVEIGDVAVMPNAQFTIRMTPIASADQAVPGYVDGLEPVLPVDVLPGETYTGTVEVAPTPEVALSAPLEIRVTDADLNQDPLVAETVTVIISDGFKTGNVTLTERSADYGVFEGTAEGFTDLRGATVKVTYNDAANAEGAAVEVTATTKVEGLFIVPSDSSGGGCALNENADFDPLLPAIVLSALGFMGFRRYQSNKVSR